jgi:DNA-binding CsgD family transcriptional regulator
MDEMELASSPVLTRGLDIDSLALDASIGTTDSSSDMGEAAAWRRGRSAVTPLLWGAAQFVLDQLPVGVVLTDGALRVTMTNRALDARFQAQDGVMLREGTFTLMDPQAHRQLMEGVAAHTEGSAQVRFAVRARRTGARTDLHVLVTPVRDGQWSIWVFDPAGTRGLSHELLRDLHGLTDAEAKVASALFMGRSTKEVAVTLSISVNTVKAHLKGIFRKCGVRSQAELSQLLALGCWNI